MLFVLYVLHSAKILILSKDGIIEKNFVWAPHLWVGRRKEPILGYVLKNNEKRIHAFKG